MHVEIQESEKYEGEEEEREQCTKLKKNDKNAHHYSNDYLTQLNISIQMNSHLTM